MLLSILHRWAAALRRSAGAFRRDREGVTLIEFAYIAPIFFLVLFSIIEIALISFSTSTFRTGLAYASRLVRTGDAQCLSDADFIEAICSRTTLAPSCATRTEVEREVYPSGFTTDVDLAIDVDEFAALESGDVVLIRATYRWPLQSPLVEPFFTDGEGDFPYQVSFLFKNEEFFSAVCP